MQGDVDNRSDSAALYAENAGHQFTYHIVPPEVLQTEDYFSLPTQHMIVDTSKFRKETGFTEPVSLKEAIKRTYEWALQHPQVLASIPDNGEAKALADVYERLVRSLNREIRSLNQNDSPKGLEPK